MRPALGMHIFITQAMQGNDITVHGNGKQTRTLTYVEDVANAFLLAVQNFNDACGNTFNISSEEKISAIKMAKDIKRLLKSKSRIKSISQRKNQTFKENICIKKTKKLLKWKPDTGWNDGFKKTVLNFK
jgi:nucleoside-diphosphate-sugar epimerase